MAHGRLWMRRAMPAGTDEMKWGVRKVRARTAHAEEARWTAQPSTARLPWPTHNKDGLQEPAYTDALQTQCVIETDEKP
jgi:hypothetical protein